MLNTKKLIKKVKAPKGFRFVVRKNVYENWQVTLYRIFRGHLDPIGHIELMRDYGKTYETHSNLDAAYHDQGLGALMYAKAIEWCLIRGYRCKSSGYPSEYAQRVWRGKTIRKYFDIKDRATARGSEARTFFAYFKKYKK